MNYSDIKSWLWKRAALFAVCFVLFVVYVTSPREQVGADARYTIYLAERIIWKQTIEFDRAVLESGAQQGLPYQIVEIDGKLLPLYPLGSSILSIPFVLPLNLVGIKSHTSEWGHNIAREVKMQRLIAAILVTLSLFVLGLIGEKLLPNHWNLFLILALGLGSPFWTTLSRAMWSHTWGVLILSVILYQLLRITQDREIKHHAGWIALGCVLLYWVKPSFASSIIVISVYLIILRIKNIIPLAIVGLSGLLSFIAVSLYYFKQPLSPYYSLGKVFDFSVFPVNLYGLLLSPSRGLLVYVPLALGALVLLVTFWKKLPAKGLVLVSIIAFLFELFLLALWPVWWGGWSYGPRLVAGTMPLLTFIVFAATSAYLEIDSSIRKKALGVGIGTLACLGILINVPGAFSESAWSDWNNAMDKDHHRLWDWDDPQFLAPLRGKWFVRGHEYPTLWQNRWVEVGNPLFAEYFGAGWGVPENQFRWIDSEEAVVKFTIRNPSENAKISFQAFPFAANGQVSPPTLRVYLNDHPVTEEPLVIDSENVYRLPVEKDWFRKRNTLMFVTSEGTSPKSLGMGSDDRELSVAIRWISRE